MRTLRNKVLNSKKMPQLLLTAIVSLSLTLGWGSTSILQAQEQHEGKEHHAEKEGKVKIPPTLSGIWQEVKEHQEELHGVLAAKKLGEVHAVAFEIRDFCAAMPKKSIQLSKEKQVALKQSVGRIASLAKYLDEAGDAGDSAKVATLLARLDKELTQIEALYPTKTLKPAKASSATETAHAMYYCKMHLEVVSDKPGKCSKCGMDLVMKEDTK